MSRTPLRVSFFGGGTDYPEFFQRSRGAVLGMAIDKYVYVAALRLPSILEYRWRVAYSMVEKVLEVDQLKHPVIREVIRHHGITEPLDFSIISDLPARSGLGSSSSLTVGLLNLVFELQGRRATKLDLAREAVMVERDLLSENVGVQDQYHASFGGLNRFDFEPSRTRISPIQMSQSCLDAFTNSLYLVYTGVTRWASETLGEQLENTRRGRADSDLSRLLALVDQGEIVLQSADPDRMLFDFGALLHEGWETKKRLSSKVSSNHIDALYAAALEAGALGGKLCGAGSGGFLLLLVPRANQERFVERLGRNGVVKVGLDAVGTTILRG